MGPTSDLSGSAENGSLLGTITTAQPMFNTLSIKWVGRCHTDGQTTWARATPSPQAFGLDWTIEA